MFVVFEEISGFLPVQKIPNVDLVHGLNAIDAHSNPPNGWGELRPIPVLLQDIRRRISSSASKRLVMASHSYRVETTDVVVVIDCITHLFLEPLVDPVHFLGPLLSLQRKNKDPRHLLI